MLDISDQKNKYIVAVINCYLSLTEIDKFQLDFASCLADISAGNKIFYAVGDININIDESNRTDTAIEYLKIILSSEALLIITIPTGVTSSCSIIIDRPPWLRYWPHHITNDFKHNVIPFVIQEDMTDHFRIGCFKQNLSPKQQKKRSKRSPNTQKNPNSILKIFGIIFNWNFSAILLKCLT